MRLPAGAVISLVRKLQLVLLECQSLKVLRKGGALGGGLLNVRLRIVLEPADGVVRLEREALQGSLSIVGVEVRLFA